MNPTPAPGLRLAVVLLVALLIGGLGALLGVALPGVAPSQQTLPLPYRVAANPGGTALRLAMVHNVIHQRYARHGESFYRARNERAQAAIAALEGGRSTLADLLHYDDLGAGLDKLGRSLEAIEVLERKLARLRERWPDEPSPRAKPAALFWTAGQCAELAGEPTIELDLSDRQRFAAQRQELEPLRAAYYRTYANLGTFRVHAHFGACLGGDEAARREVERGLAEVERALALNPGAHFGREAWQVHAIRHFLQVASEAEFAARFDLVGHELSPERPFHYVQQREGGRWALREVRSALRRNEGRLSDLSLDERLRVRAVIPRVGNEAGYVERVGSFPRGTFDPTGVVPNPQGDLPLVTTVPFDEPTLGILGMWMLGGGPNPHFALALGSIMERVGQRRLAWDAYERALGLAERFSPRAEVRRALVGYCQTRQERLAEDLGIPAEQLRSEHEQELARGVAHQEAQAAWEAAQIAAGADPSAPDFLGAFRAEHPIASRPGGADERSYQGGRRGPSLWRVLAFGALGAALGAALGLRVRPRR